MRKITKHINTQSENMALVCLPFIPFSVMITVIKKTEYLRKVQKWKQNKAFSSNQAENIFSACEIVKHFREA